VTPSAVVVLYRFCASASSSKRRGRRQADEL
jgi:hypothetical protein